MLALGLDGRGHDDLGVVHFLDSLSADHAHAYSERAYQVLGAVGKRCRAKEDLFQRAFGVIMLLMLPVILRNPRPRSGAAPRRVG